MFLLTILLTWTLFTGHIECNPVQATSAVNNVEQQGTPEQQPQEQPQQQQNGSNLASSSLPQAQSEQSNVAVPANETPSDTPQSLAQSAFQAMSPQFQQSILSGLQTPIVQNAAGIYGPRVGQPYGALRFPPPGGVHTKKPKHDEEALLSGKHGRSKKRGRQRRRRHYRIRRNKRGKGKNGWRRGKGKVMQRCVDGMAGTEFCNENEKDCMTTDAKVASKMRAACCDFCRKRGILITVAHSYLKRMSEQKT